MPSAADACRAQLNRVGCQRRAEPSLDLLYTQGTCFWELFYSESWFRQKKTFASSIRGQPGPKNRKPLDPVRYSFARRSLKLAILLDPMRFKLQKSRAKTAPKLANFGLTARWRPPALERGPASGPPALYLVIAIAWYMFCVTRCRLERFWQNDTFASSICDQPGPKNGNHE